MEEVQKIVSKFLLAFQVTLGSWQFVKLTPVGGLVHGVMGWLLSPLPCLSSDYALLQHCPGRVFKSVDCVVLTKVPGLHEELIATADRVPREIPEIMAFNYLGNHFRLRRDGNKLFVNEKMSYYITDAIWRNLLLMENVMESIDGKTDKICLKGYKSFWKSVVTGGVMPLSEALDCIILEDHAIMFSDKDFLLPVNLSLSEEKTLKLLNLAGLFLQTKKVFWLIPTLLSLVSAILEFNTKLRAWLYRNINRVFCWSMHLFCDKLRYSMRRQVYSLGVWLENLQPCNDIEFRVVRGDICALIAGGAKAHTEEDAAAVPWLSVEEGQTDQRFDCDPIVFECGFNDDLTQFVVVWYSNGEQAGVMVDCKSREEFMKMCTLVDCIARNRSGSLKSYDGTKNKVKVRGWKESVRHYAKNGYPPIYELKLNNVIVDIM